MFQIIINYEVFDYNYEFYFSKGITSCAIAYFGLMLQHCHGCNILAFPHALYLPVIHSTSHICHKIGSSCKPVTAHSEMQSLCSHIASADTENDQSGAASCSYAYHPSRRWHALVAWLVCILAVQCHCLYKCS